MNPIDPMTLAAIGGQKTQEAAKSFADTMLQLYRTKKEAALLDQQTEAARLANVRTAATQEADIEADVATSKAKTQEATEFVSPEAKATREMQQKAATGKAMESLADSEQYFSTLPERQQIEMNQLATQKAGTQMQAYQMTLANLPAQGSTATGFAKWKADNADLVERMSADPKLAPIMKKQVLTPADSRLIQAKQEQIIGQTPEWAEYYMKTMLEHNLTMEQLRAKEKAERAAKTPDNKWAALPAAQAAEGFSSLPNVDKNMATTATNAYIGWETAIKNNALEPVPNDKLYDMLGNMAKQHSTGPIRGMFGTPDNTVAFSNSAGRALNSYKMFLDSGGREDPSEFLAPFYNMDKATASHVYKQWRTLREPTLDALWALAEQAYADPKRKPYFIED